MRMWYWRDGWFKSLAQVASQAADRGDMADYVTYLHLQEKGLRQQAFEAVTRFVGAALARPLTERISIVDWMLSVAEGAEASTVLIPHPLRSDLIEPTLAEWRLQSPTDPRPLRWSSDAAMWRRAIHLDRDEQIARRRLIASLLGAVDYSTHEVIGGTCYIGDPQSDMAALDEVTMLIQGLSDDDDHRALLQREVSEYRTTIGNYLKQQKKNPNPAPEATR